MTSRTEIERILREAYAARVRNDVAGTAQHFAPNARFAMAGGAHASPVAMRIEGGDQVRAVLDGLIKAFVLSNHQIVTLLVDGDNAAVHWRATVRSSVTGDTITTEACDLVAFKDGKIVSFIEFCDTAAAARLMGSGG